MTFKLSSTQSIIISNMVFTILFPFLVLKSLCSCYKKNYVQHHYKLNISSFSEFSGTIIKEKQIMEITLA